jgi:lysophospholipase L1-like esterase
VNDFASGKTALSVEQNLQAINDLATRDRANVIYLTVLPWEGYRAQNYVSDAQPGSSWTSYKQSQTEALNAWVRGRTHIDTYEYMNDDADPERMKTAYQGNALPDGYLHPKPTGYQAMANYVAQQLGTRCGVTATS